MRNCATVAKQKLEVEVTACGVEIAAPQHPANALQTLQAWHGSLLHVLHAGNRNLWFSSPL